MTSLRRYILFVLLFVSGTVLAQKDDTALWGIISVKLPLKHNWLAMVRSEIHTKNNTSEMDYWYVSGGAGYKFNKWLRTDFGLIYVAYHGSATETLPSYWRPMYRTYVTFSETAKVGNVRGTLREYWGYCNMPATTVEGVYKGGTAYHELRIRLRLDYVIPNSKFTPYVFVEEWNTKKLDRIRYVGGVDYKLDKHNTIGLFYMWQDKYKSTDTHVYGIEYGLLL